MSDTISFAIGDVHGCAQKLQSLIAACEILSAGKGTRFILVGDYVDRGPNSKSVLDFLINEQSRDPSRVLVSVATTRRRFLPPRRLSALAAI